MNSPPSLKLYKTKDDEIITDSDSYSDDQLTLVYDSENPDVEHYHYQLEFLRGVLMNYTTLCKIEKATHDCKNDNRYAANRVLLLSNSLLPGGCQIFHKVMREISPEITGYIYPHKGTLRWNCGNGGDSSWIEITLELQI